MLGHRRLTFIFILVTLILLLANALVMATGHKVQTDPFVPSKHEISRHVATYSLLSLGIYPLRKLHQLRRHCRSIQTPNACTQTDGCQWTSTSARCTSSFRHLLADRRAKCAHFTQSDTCDHQLTCRWLRNQCGVHVAAVLRYATVRPTDRVLDGAVWAERRRRAVDAVMTTVRSDDVGAFRMEWGRIQLPEKSGQRWSATLALGVWQEAVVYRRWHVLEWMLGSRNDNSAMTDFRLHVNWVFEAARRSIMEDDVTLLSRLIAWLDGCEARQSFRKLLTELAAYLRKPQTLTYLLVQCHILNIVAFLVLCELEEDQQGAKQVLELWKQEEPWLLRFAYERAQRTRNATALLLMMQDDEAMRIVSNELAQKHHEHQQLVQQRRDVLDAEWKPSPDTTRKLRGSNTSGTSTPPLESARQRNARDPRDEALAHEKLWEYLYAQQEHVLVQY